MAAARNFLITGVSSGLGAAFADAAMDAGHNVVGTVRRDEDVAAFEKRAAGRGRVLCLDVTEDGAPHAAVEQAQSLVGPIQVLVNNAGYGHEGTVEESPIDALRRQFEVNVFAPVALIQAVLPGMRAVRSGHIINVTSMAGTVGLPGIAYYCGSKFALEGISEALGKELKPLGIHVTALAPGQFRTNWAGRSMERSVRTIADYDASFDPIRDARAAKNGHQPGSPEKAAAALLAVIASPNPPSRLLAGSDALALVRQKIKRLQIEIDAWEEVSRATDF